MSRTFEYDVFLSYSYKDKEIVHAQAKRLRKDGLRVWLDNWEIKPGDMIGLKIQQGLEKSRTLIMCMSPAYFGQSGEYWSITPFYSATPLTPSVASSRSS